MTRAALAITVHNRPEYLAPVLESWYEAQMGHFLPVIFQVEPDSEETLKMCNEAKFLNQKVILNDTVAGALRNPYNALRSAFSKPDVQFVILGEDDSVVSPDVLYYFNRMMWEYEADPSVVAVCSFTHRAKGQPNQIFRQKWFASVVWGTWRDRWEDWLKDNWPFDYSPAWDQYLVDQATRLGSCVFPAVSRSQHIGEFNGTHMSPQDFGHSQADQFYQGSKITEFKEMDIG